MEPSNNVPSDITLESQSVKTTQSKNEESSSSGKNSDVEIIEQQILDADEDMYQTMNAELDKQIAEDMEAIKNYLNNPDESVAKRIEFFNKMDKTRVHCNDRPITDHILYQHTALGNIIWHECTQCEFKAREKSKLMEHLMSMHPSLAMEPFTCTHCSFKSKNNSDLKRHLYQVHNEGQIFSCKECDKNFYVNCDLLRHLEAAHDVEIFKCTQCPFISGDRPGLREHNLAQHIKLNVSWYKCAQCAYRTVRKANLDRHIMYKHSINTILL